MEGFYLSISIIMVATVGGYLVFRSAMKQYSPVEEIASDEDELNEV